MARTIPDDIITRIKNAADIVDVISDDVVLKQAGRNYLGLCPFHTEKTPSFTVSPEKQIFYCFGCHNGGNVFSYIMQHEGLSFPEAVRYLGVKYGIEVPDAHLTSEQKRTLSEKEKLFRINQLAASFFRKTLLDPHAGQKGLTYLLGRGMTRKIIDGYGLGYAPDRWDGLLRHLENKRVPVDLVVKAGLIIQRREGSGHYDRFRDRIMFPIFDTNQQIIGFGGRVMGDGSPKYLNSPESTIYNKSHSLYGIEKAKQPARKSGTVYLVEGYFDALALHLYGITNSVATLGTSLTSHHVQLIKGMVGPSGKATLVYDSDDAGIKAAHRSIGIFEQELLEARILVLPKGYDPDEFLREYGPDDFLAAAEKAVGIIHFLIEAAIQKHGLSLEGKVRVVASLEAPLTAVQDSVARSLYIKYLAERIDVDEAVVMAKVRQSLAKKGSNPNKHQQENLKFTASDGNRLEEQIISMMLHYPKMIPEIVGRNLLDYFFNTQLKKIGQMILSGKDLQENKVADFISKIDSPQYRNLMTKLAIGEQRWDRQGCERLLTQFEFRFRRKCYNDLQRQIEVAEKENNLELLCELLKQKQIKVRKGLTNS